MNDWVGKISKVGSPTLRLLKSLIGLGFDDDDIPKVPARAPWDSIQSSKSTLPKWAVEVRA